MVPVSLQGESKQRAASTTSTNEVRMNEILAGRKNRMLSKFISNLFYVFPEFKMSINV